MGTTHYTCSFKTVEWNEKSRSMINCINMILASGMSLGYDIEINLKLKELATDWNNIDNGIQAKS